MKVLHGYAALEWALSRQCFLDLEWFAAGEWEQFPLDLAVAVIVCDEAPRTLRMIVYCDSEEMHALVESVRRGERRECVDRYLGDVLGRVSFAA